MSNYKKCRKIELRDIHRFSKEGYSFSDNFLNSQNYVFGKNKDYLDVTFFSYKYRFYGTGDSIYGNKNFLLKEKIDIKFNSIVLDIDYYYTYKSTTKSANYVKYFFIFFLFSLLFYAYSLKDLNLIIVTVFGGIIFVFFILLNSIEIVTSKGSCYYILRYKPNKLLLLKLR